MNDYLIKTKNLGFRLIKKDDLHLWIKLYGDPAVTQFLASGSRSQEQMQDRINNVILTYEQKSIPSFFIFELNSGEFVGRAGFAETPVGDIEVGYVLQKKFWGKGYATEALIALLKWGKKNIDAEYIIAFTPVEHHTSQRVLLKCGMKHYKDEIDRGNECRYYRIKNK